MIYVSLILPAYSSSTEGPLDVEEQQYELADDELSGDEFEPEPKTPSENLMGRRRLLQYKTQVITDATSSGNGVGNLIPYTDLNLA